MHSLNDKMLTNANDCTFIYGVIGYFFYSNSLIREGHDQATNYTRLIPSIIRWNCTVFIL